MPKHTRELIHSEVCRLPLGYTLCLQTEDTLVFLSFKYSELLVGKTQFTFIHEMRELETKLTS